MDAFGWKTEKSIPMGRDGTVVEIREDAERAWLFKVGDRIVAAMDEFFWSYVLFFENIIEKRTCLFHESFFFVHLFL